MKVSELISAIRMRDAVLPEFQREYVWSREQAKQLLVSLTRDYPVGSLLFWNTDQPPELKNIDWLPEKLGTVQVILDGQQRLTTLYLLIAGEIPPYYRSRDIRNDPRDLFYNLDTGEFQYYLASQMRGSPLWRRVVDCFNEKPGIFRIAKQVGRDDHEVVELAERYNDNLTRLQNIRNMDLPIQLVPAPAGIRDAIDVFDRVNSQGTPLSKADLALTHVTGKWSQARRVMKGKLDELSKQGFRFKLTFMTRALTGVVVRRALFETIHDRQREELQEGWQTLSKILDYLVTVLPGTAFIHSTEDLNTTNVLVPLVVYLSLHGGKFPSDAVLKNAIHWLYAAHTWSRYTAQTDQRLEHDVSLVVREEHPWDALRAQIIDQRGRMEVKAADLEGRGTQHPLYRMTAILAKACGAVDWFNGAPLGPTHGAAYRVHSHHIFPTSVLYKSGYDPENHLHRKVVNEIANRAFLTAETNLALSSSLPEQYLPEVEKNYPGALVKQFIPMVPALWTVERYADFLEARRQMMALKLNEFMKALISKPEMVHERPVAELIALGESATLEFKSTLQWDMVENRVNKRLRYSVLKTIAAFLNSAGGTLVVGVEDDGHICGLSNDLKTTHHSLDGFAQLLTSLIAERIGAQYAGFIRNRFESVGEQTVCVVDVDKAAEPVFVKEPGESVFYIRFGNTTRSLDAEEAVSYIQMSWE